MAEQQFRRVEEVAHKLVVFKSYVYKIVKKLNQDLKEKGYMTISGWVNRKYFQEKPVIAGWKGRNRNGSLQRGKDKHMARNLPLRYTDWTGERKQSQKQGFKTKRETQAWEHEQLNKTTADLDMSFARFVEQYTADMRRCLSR